MVDTLAANVAELSQELVDATVMQMPQVAPLMNLVERIDIPTGRNSVEIPRANSTFSVQTPTEGDDIVESSQFDLTSTSIAPTLRAINIRISERARYFSQQDTLRLISQELARAQGQDVDTDISAEFANFGQSAGVTNTDLTISTLREARRKLQANTVANGGPSPDPIYTVLAPIPVENLMTNLGLQGVVPVGTASGQQFVSQGLSEEFIRQYFVDGINLVGVGTFWDGYLTEDGSGDFICSMHSRSALQLAMSKDWDMRQFEESEWIGVIIRSVADYNSGVGKFPNWGVKITADGA
jgi:hypothetical protein